MGEPAVKKPFVPRENLKRELSYRIFTKTSYYYFLTFGGLYWLVCAAAASVQYRMMGNLESSLTTLGVGTFVTVVSLVFSRLVLRPLVFTKYNVSPEGLKISMMSETKDIAYANLQSVDFSLVPYLGGHFILNMKDGSTQKITVNLGRSEYILESIATYNSGLIPLETLMKHRRTAVVCDHGFVRLFNKLRNWKMGFFKFFVLPFLCTYLNLYAQNTVAINFDFRMSLTHFIRLFEFIEVNFFVGFMIWIASEILFVLKVRSDLIRSPNDVIFNHSFDQNLNKWTSLLHIGVMLVLAYTLDFWSL